MDNINEIIRNLVKDEVQACFEKNSMNKESAESSIKTLSEKEAAIYLKRSKVTLWRLRRAGVLPYHKFGNRILYKKIDLDNFIDSNYISIS